MDETTVVQVRGVPSEVVETLKARAARRGLSLTAFLRELFTAEAQLPAIDVVMARLSEDEPVDYSAADLRRFAADGRR